MEDSYQFPDEFMTGEKGMVGAIGSKAQLVPKFTDSTRDESGARLWIFCQLSTATTTTSNHHSTGGHQPETWWLTSSPSLVRDVGQAGWCRTSLWC